jgi:hypothetical protein
VPQALTDALRACFACANPMIKKLAPACGGGYGLTLFDLDPVAGTTRDHLGWVVERTTNVLKGLCGVPSVPAVHVESHARIGVAAVPTERLERFPRVRNALVSIELE